METDNTAGYDNVKVNVIKESHEELKTPLNYFFILIVKYKNFS